MIGVLNVMRDLDAVVVHGGEMNHHRSEKRLARLKPNLASLSCGWARVCGPCKPDHLLFTMEERYCIRCNRRHWFFLERIEWEQPKFNPNDYDILELREMGYFEQFLESK